MTVGFTPTFRSRSRLQLVPLELAVGRPPRIPSVSSVLTCRRQPDREEITGMHDALCQACAGRKVKFTGLTQTSQVDPAV